MLHQVKHLNVTELLCNTDVIKTWWSKKQALLNLHSPEST